ncbi:MAG: hypothetical protein AAFR21_02750 [Pseudomonadota bacterium]
MSSKIRTLTTIIATAAIALISTSAIADDAATETNAVYAFAGNSSSIASGGVATAAILSNLTAYSTSQYSTLNAKTLQKAEDSINSRLYTLEPDYSTFNFGE